MEKGDKEEKEEKKKVFGTRQKRVKTWNQLRKRASMRECL